jgi:SAM-dependent methyltransferase
MESFARDFADLLGVGEDAEVLEVACGSGALSVTLAHRAKSLLATDFSPNMVKGLQARLAAEGLGNARAELMNALQLELREGSFDAVACSFGLMLFSDRAKGFGELFRVLRPGGRALVSGWAGPDQFESFGLFLAALRRAVPDLPPPPGPPPVFSLANPESFAAEMRAAGFESVDVRLLCKTLTVDNFEQLWQMMTAGAPPVQVLFDQVGPAGERRIEHCLREIVRERFGEGPITCTNAATVGTGTKPS